MVAEHHFSKHPFLGVFYFYQSVQLFLPKIIGIARRRQINETHELSLLSATSVTDWGE
jgi:hypothetical protein